MKTDEPAATADESTASRGASRAPAPQTRTDAAPPAGASAPRANTAPPLGATPSSQTDRVPPAGVPSSPTDSVPPAAAPAPGDIRHDEAVALLRLAARLKAAYPSVDPSVVDQVVATARGSFRQAKVRTYVPILIERRVRALLSGLGGDEAAPAPAAPGGTGAGGTMTAGTAEQSAERPRRTPLLGRWIPARLRPAPASASDLGGVGERP
ncbi:three-helix bundle dimerization domain-containing protein [Streptomyces sp. NPDC059618]|uniref:three-helix bundle dimerization domain-containing protein n=1 Tax=Streptomyces sp. NPDC059618 TaxID=3346887 RepID=UPI003673D426